MFPGRQKRKQTQMAWRKIRWDFIHFNVGPKVWRKLLHILGFGFCSSLVFEICGSSSFMVILIKDKIVIGLKEFSLSKCINEEKVPKRKTNGNSNKVNTAWKDFLSIKRPFFVSLALIQETFPKKTNIYQQSLW